MTKKNIKQALIIIILVALVFLLKEGKNYFYNQKVLNNYLFVYEEDDFACQTVGLKDTNVTIKRKDDDN